MRLTAEQIADEAYDEECGALFEQERRDRCDRRNDAARALVEAKRRIGQLEHVVDHRATELANVREELSRLKEVRRLTMGEAIRLNLVRDLPALRERHPDGVLIRHLVAHFGSEKAIIRLTLTKMAREGTVRWQRLRGQHEMVLMLPGEEAPTGAGAVGLSASARRTLELLREHADGEIVRVSPRTLGAETGQHPSTLNYQIACLIRAERLWLVERGEAGRPSVYSFERPEAPLAVCPSLSRQMEDMPSAPRVRKPKTAPKPNPQPPTATRPVVIVPQMRENPVIGRSLRPAPRIADDMRIELRRPVARPRADVTSRLMGDPTFQRFEAPGSARPTETLDADGAWLESEMAKMANLG